MPTNPPRPSFRLGTVAGLGAVVLWSTLALFTTLTGPIPPFQLTAMTLLVGGLVGALSWPMRPGAARALCQSPAVWLVGIGGLFGYHGLYFAALRLAPPAEAAMVNYLWPLLIVLGSGRPSSGESLSAQQLVGALCGFVGVAVLMLGGGDLHWGAASIPGYFCAAGAAVVWAGYSLASRHFGTVSTDVISGFCLATALLAGVVHVGFETTVWPQTAAQWAAVVALGVGPAGIAFYLWDFGMKRGDVRTIGLLSYATPVLTTTLLVLAGKARLHVSLGAACVLIVGGALLARTRK